MECAEFREWLHPWVDGELDLVRGLEMERHAQECPACLAEETALRELRSRFSQAAPGFRVPDGLAAGIRNMLEAESRSHHGGKALEAPAILAPAASPEEDIGPRSLRPWLRPGLRRVVRSVPVAWAGALAAVVLLSAALLVWELDWKKESGLEGLGQELADNHFRSLQVSHLMDVASSDQHTVKPWFAGKLDFSPPVEDLVNFGFPLVGGRLDYVQRHPVAALVYRRNLHVINLYCWPDRDRDAGGGALFHAQRQGYHILLWKSGDFRWGAVSDLNETELRQFAHLLRTPVSGR